MGNIAKIAAGWSYIALRVFFYRFYPSKSNQKYDDTSVIITYNLHMEKENFRFCRKCLTRDMITKDEYFKTLQELIENIPEEIKTPSDLYEKRLHTCTEC